MLASAPPNDIGGSEIQAFRLFSKLKQKGHSVFIIALSSKSFVSKWDGIEVLSIKNNNLIFYSLTKLRNILLKFRLKRNKKNKQKNYDDLKTKINGQDYVNKAISLPYFLLFHFPLIIKTLYKLFSTRKKYDIIYVPLMEYQAIIACLAGFLFKKKVVIKDSTMNGLTNLLRYPFGSIFQRFVIKQSTMFIAISSTILNNYIISGIPKSKTIFIPNGIDIVTITKRKPIQGRCLFIGNLYQQPAKGVDILLQAWVAVQLCYSNATLYIIGKGDLEFYKNYSKSLGIENSVYFLGSQNNVTKFYQEADIFILPSRREGLSNSLLEAINYGVPVIATNISGSKDLIVNDFNGFLIEVNDIKNLSKRIITLISDYNRKELFSSRSRDVLINNYDLNIIAKMYIQLFTNLNN